MADLSEQAPFEGLYTRKSNTRRRLSYASQTSGRSAIPASASLPRATQLRPQTSTRSIRSLAESEADRYEIHSPTPRRHFLLQTESNQWLRPQLMSPASSRPVSPLSPASTQQLPSPFPSSSGQAQRQPSLNFGSLFEHDRVTAKQRKELFERDARKSEVGIDGGAGARWIKWMHRNRMRDRVTLCSIAAAACIKWCVGLGGYSGQGIPPMYGDFEAQRHWMELTIHLPTRQWYTYDLQYWGLDYPPLTAYHSWLCGMVGSFINPSWFELGKSRGIETEESKIFMRSTVLVSDLLVYIPALIFFVHAWHNNRSKRTQGLALLCLLLQPSLILIDSGHFQFNSVMLGFTLLALNFFSRSQDLLGAIFFVASLGFKQMSLYYAPAIGSYLLGRCLYFGSKTGFHLFLRLALVTTAAFVILFLPFIPPLAPIGTILDPLSRIFPFSRGLFEDKVANFWCASNVIFKWRSWLSQPQLIKMSALLTILGFLPTAINLIMGSIKARDPIDQNPVLNEAIKTNKKEDIIATPTLPILPWALLSSSMSFFLFSFQVHEKTILIPLLPLNLLLSGASRSSFTFEWGMFVNNVAIFSLWPLLKKEGLGIPYVAVTFLWNHIMGYYPFGKSSQRPAFRYFVNWIYVAIFLIHTLETVVTPPRRYPDLFSTLNVLIGAPVFAITWLWSIKRSTEVTWSLSAMRVRSRGSDEQNPEK